MTKSGKIRFMPLIFNPDTYEQPFPEIDWDASYAAAVEQLETNNQPEPPATDSESESEE